MVNRIRAQAEQLKFKAQAASASGDQAGWIRLQREWVRLMKLAMDANETFYGIYCK
jgi:hypothetical protein